MLDSIIFDLDGTLITEASRKRGVHGFHPGLDYVCLPDGRYLVPRPFAVESVLLARQIARKVILWSWNPVLPEAVFWLEWENLFHRIVGIRDFSPHMFHQGLEKELAWIVNDPRSSVIIQDYDGAIVPSNRAIRVPTYAGLPADPHLLSALEEVCKRHPEARPAVGPALETYLDELKTRALPRYHRTQFQKDSLKELTVLPIGGHEVVFTPEGVDLWQRMGEPLLDCLGHTADAPSEIPVEFKCALLSESDHAVCYRADWMGLDLVFKFYRRNTLPEKDGVKFGIDQLEAAYHVNTATDHWSPIPYFASNDVFCMAYVPDLTGLPDYVKKNPTRESDTRFRRRKIMERLSSEVLVEKASFRTVGDHEDADFCVLDMKGRMTGSFSPFFSRKNHFLKMEPPVPKKSMGKPLEIPPVPREVEASDPV